MQIPVLKTCTSEWSTLFCNPERVAFALLNEKLKRNVMFPGVLRHCCIHGSAWFLLIGPVKVIVPESHLITTLTAHWINYSALGADIIITVHQGASCQSERASWWLVTNPTDLHLDSNFQAISRFFCMGSSCVVYPLRTSREDNWSAKSMA